MSIIRNYNILSPCVDTMQNNLNVLRQPEIWCPSAPCKELPSTSGRELMPGSSVVIFPITGTTGNKQRDGKSKATWSRVSWPAFTASFWDVSCAGGGGSSGSCVSDLRRVGACRGIEGLIPGCCFLISPLLWDDSAGFCLKIGKPDPRVVPVWMDLTPNIFCYHVFK